MASYQALLNRVWGALAEESTRPLPDEIELQALWFAGAFGRNFRCTRGRPVRIVQFGEWNRGAGPDFLRGVVEVDGHEFRGAIELDPDPADWEAHGHGANPAYADVVLHVTFAPALNDAFTRDHRHREIPRVEIPAPLLAEALQCPSRATAIARPGRCVQPLAKLPEASVRSLIHQAARHRCALKAARFLRMADAHGRDAALYQVTAESLGYRANTLAMRLLAQRVPITPLRESGETTAILFGSAGFLSPDLHESAPADTRQHLRQLWDHWWKERATWESSHPIPWRWNGQRPANHPHRRVAALAALVRQWSAYRRRALARPFQIKPLLDFLTTLEDPFWSHRHTLSSSPSKQSIALFGKSRATELLATHLIPLALHEESGFSFEDYLKLPAAAPNESVRRCAIRLFGSEQAAAPWLKKSAHHQALLQIYHDFCLEDSSDCLLCPFPEQLSQWT
ncbi:MAG: DUF2851 family protein [Akkermansiaceae bacterium]|jgi:hypothetical protein|nr:DUF2851 family protein [Akkermansiaceae bacterium]